MGIFQYNAFHLVSPFSTVFPAKKRILETILREQEIHGYTLAKQLRLNTATIYEHLKTLERNGYIRSRVAGRRRMYSLTDKGKKLTEIL